MPPALDEPARRAPGPTGVRALTAPLRFRRDPLAYFLDLARHGPLVRTRAGPFVFHTAFAPELVRAVLVEGADVFLKRGVLDELVPVLGDGLLISEGERWRARRLAAQPAFARRAVEAFLPGMEAEARALVERWRAELRAGAGVVDASQGAMELALAVVARTLFGAELGARAAALSRAVEDVSRCAYARTNALLRLPLAWPSATNRTYRRAIATLDESVRALLAGGVPPEGIFARLAATRDPRTGQLLGPDDLRDEAMTLFLAGHETSASTLAWTLDHLARETELQERLRSEADAALGSGPAPAALERLPWLDATVAEVLRLHPPAWLVVRRAAAPARLGGFAIPARSFVSIPVHALQRAPSAWPEPERFRPERFLGGAPTDPGLYLPFGAGPRRCLGEAFARQELRVVVARLLQAFRLEAVGPPPAPLPLATLRPASPVRLRLASLGA
ncbi:MAG TPA: cytochrome P450 [Planctomycetota bacterium]